MADPLNTKEMAYLLRLNENKGYQWVEEVPLHQVRIAGKWPFLKEHIFRWNDESVQRGRDLLIVGEIISLSLRFMGNGSGSCCEEDRR